MDSRTKLLAAALQVLERDGQDQFKTRAVCDIAGVTAPTLYHYFGSIDGLLSAAIAQAFAEFLAHKAAVEAAPDPAIGLRDGWDNYVRFAAERPRLYSAMVARVLQGADIPAADQARELLRLQIQAVADADRLAMDADAAVELAWASAHAAASLYTPAWDRTPHPDIIARLRDDALRAICRPHPKGKQS